MLGGTSGLSFQCRWKHQKSSQWEKRRRFTHTYTENLEPLLISGETPNSPSRTCGLSGCFGSTLFHMNTLYVQFVLPKLYLLLGLQSTDKKQKKKVSPYVSQLLLTSAFNMSLENILNFFFPHYTYSCTPVGLGYCRPPPVPLTFTKSALLFLF